MDTIHGHSWAFFADFGKCELFCGAVIALGEAQPELHTVELAIG